MKKTGFVRVIFGLMFCTLALLCAGIETRVSAQPTDAQVKQDLTSARTVSVTLGKPGAIEWSKTYKKYVWSRNFTAKLKTDDTDIFVIVKGYISYDVMGGKYVKWRTFTTSNNYEGIPDPTASDVQVLIGKFGVEQFIGNFDFNRVIGKVESIGLGREPKIVWHTPNSVSFDVVAVYTKKTNDIGGRERIARTYEIRLYRDAVKAAWKNLMSTPRAVEKL